MFITNYIIGSKIDEDLYALLNSFFVFARMIGEWWGSLIIHLISDPGYGQQAIIIVVCSIKC